MALRQTIDESQTEPSMLSLNLALAALMSGYQVEYSMVYVCESEWVSGAVMRCAESERANDALDLDRGACTSTPNDRPRRE